MGDASECTVDERRATRCRSTWTLRSPELFHHGTVERALAAIREHGLRPMVPAVRAGAVHAAGHEFRGSANGVWLTEHVAPPYHDSRTS